MLIRELINEIATAGATSAGNIATVASPRGLIKKKKKNVENTVLPSSQKKKNPRWYN